MRIIFCACGKIALFKPTLKPTGRLKQSYFTARAEYYTHDCISSFRAGNPFLDIKLRQNNLLQFLSISAHNQILHFPWFMYVGLDYDREYMRFWLILVWLNAQKWEMSHKSRNNQFDLIAIVTYRWQRSCTIWKTAVFELHL